MVRWLRPVELKIMSRLGRDARQVLFVFAATTNDCDKHTDLRFQAGDTRQPVKAGQIHRAR
jgi:hypothetical protein